MRTRTTRLVMLACSLLAASCGGGTTPEPLIATTVVGSYAGEEFIPVNGFATVYREDSIIVLSDAAVACGTENDNTPPPGHTTALNVPALAVGSYSNVFVQMYNNVGRFDGVGQNSGTVTISSVTDESIVGEVTFTYTDNENRDFSFTGTFEVAHCAY